QRLHPDKCTGPCERPALACHVHTTRMNGHLAAEITTRLALSRGCYVRGWPPTSRTFGPQSTRSCIRLCARFRDTAPASEMCSAEWTCASTQQRTMLLLAFRAPLFDPHHRRRRHVTDSLAFVVEK